MSNLENIIWEEKYRPQTIAECILPKDAKEFFASIIKKDEMPNLLLSGPPGIGKTTTAKALCNELNYETLLINGSNEGRLIDTLRNKIQQFASSMSLSGQKKCVIIDEADGLPEAIQDALRTFINEFSRIGVKFIFTCNYPNKITDALHSRFAVIDFTIPNDEALQLMGEAAKRVKFILAQENISDVDDVVLIKLIKKYFPDMRRVLNEIQYKTGHGKLDSSALTGVVNTELTDLVKFMANSDVRSIREWVAKQPYLSQEDISSSLYKNMYSICSKDTMAQFITILAEWQYKSNFMPDKEIALMAMFVDLLMQCEITELKE